jgi:hypothetical protein
MDKKFNNIGPLESVTLIEPWLNRKFYKKKKKLKDFFVDAVDHDVADLDPM